MEEQINKKEQYNSIPVHYCKNCLSLKIIAGDGYDYCDECGGTSIETCSIEEWEKLYEDNYGYNYLKGKEDNSLYKKIFGVSYGGRK